MPPIVGGGGSNEERKDTLTELINKINKRFGTEFTEIDKVMLQIKNDFVQDQEAKDFVKNNKKSMFDIIYGDKFRKIFINRYEQNDEFFKEAITNEEFMTMIMDSLKPEIYEMLKRA